MRKKVQSKLLSGLLAVGIAVFAALPCAAAESQTPRQSWLLAPQALDVVGRVLANTARRFRTGGDDYDEIVRLFASLPVLPDDGADSQSLWEALRAIFAGGVYNGTVVLKETAGEGVYLLGARYNDRQRREKQVFDFIGEIEYNSLTGFFKGKDGRGVLGIGFDYDASQYLVRSAAQSWLKVMGYNAFYDAVAPLLGVMIDTQRFPFEYGGEDWMVQMWKGIYFASFHGAEVGLYHKPPGRGVDHYDAAALALPLSLEVYSGGELLFSTGEHDSWWMAGFQYGSPLVNIFSARELRVEGVMRFPEKGMLEAFRAAFDRLKPPGLTGTAQGLAFRFVWGEG